MQIGFIVSLIFAIIITVFALKNGNDVSVDFIIFKREVSQAIVIFVSAALGAIIVTLLGLFRQIKMSLKIREMTKKVNNLENEKKELEDKVLEECENEKSVENVKEVQNLDEVKQVNDKLEENIRDDNDINIEEK